ncbi:MAG TPA: alpha-2-macroglobulin family protein [Crocinitomicaceae bacterium]|nr:alpha-2-macroglobulin family protein [Crocinitomicaceae bacterium]
MKNIQSKILVAFFALFLLSGSCEKQDNNTSAVENKVQNKDKSQTKISEFPDYEKAWQTVDSLDKLQQYLSALNVVNTIMQKAEKEQSTPVQIKALMYQMKYNQVLEENDFVKALNRIDVLRAKNQTTPLYSLLSSIKAEMLTSYFQQNRYRFYNRSTTQNFELGDVTTWDLKTLLYETQQLYVQSLQHKNILQKTPLQEYAYILENAKQESYQTTPTLYDFLANRALMFFAHDEMSITRPDAKFNINNPLYFGTNEEFTKLNTETQDTLSNLVYWVRTMQDLTKFHETSTFATTRLYNTLERLKFTYTKSTLENKTELYKNALLREQKNYENNPLVADVNSYLVDLYINLNKNSIPNTPEYQLLIDAHKLCEQILSKYGKNENSLGIKNIRSAKNTIENSFLDGFIEQYNSSNLPILAQVQFKNIDTLYVRVYKISSGNTKYTTSLKDRLNQYKLVQTKTVQLPKIKDFNKHTTEIGLASLALGNYCLVYSSDSSYEYAENKSHWTTNFTVTDLAYSVRKINGNEAGIEVVNRYTGKAIENAKVTLFENEYNYSLRQYVRKKIDTYQTDKNGWAMTVMKTNNYYRNMEIVVKYNNDELSSSTYFYDNTTATKTISDNLFTDRAIYRPGQTVYFKGIRLETVGKKSTVLAQNDATVTFKDVNYQKVSELKLKSNEFGSYSGSFTIPTTGLTGIMRLETGHGTVTFSVEEYKRPTFKVDFSKSKEELKLGETVKIQGSAMAYAGNVVDNATVKYVVKRRLYINPWSRYYRYYPNVGSETVVAQGTTKTDEKGLFTVDFKAEKDKTKEGISSYNYTITADITDANGETRSATKYISLSDASVFLNVSATDFEKSKDNYVTISATNAEGEKVPSKGEIRIIPLDKSSVNPKRNRSWENPDMPSMNAEEYGKLFPQYHFKDKDENDKQHVTNIKYLTFNTEKSDEVKVDVSKFDAGEYLIEARTTDKNGHEILDRKHIKLLDFNTKKAPYEQLLFAKAEKTNYEPNETIKISVSTPLDNQLVLMEVNLDGKIIERQHLTLNNEQKVISYKVEEKHRGGLSFHFSTVRFGQEFEQNVYIAVPYSNKELNVTFETFRDKLAPNETEEWRLRITGPKKEKVAAELLISMYDASLDAFKNHGYNFFPHYNNIYAENRAFYGFGTSYGQSYRQYYENYSLQPISKPSLSWFGYEFYRYNDYYYMDGIKVRESQNISVASRTVSKGTGAKKEEAGNSYFSAPPPAPTRALDLEKEVSEGDLPSSYGDLEENQSQSGNVDVIPLRSNFNETAFFYPQLKTDENGDILVTFTVPESLTKWKVLGLAHTQDLKAAVFQKEVVTQKELMVQTNTPRFLRTGDEVILTAKISNLTDKIQNGTATLQLLDAVTMKNVNLPFNLVNNTTNFQAESQQSTVVSWKINVPDYLGSLVFRITAKAENHTDGEEITVPVLTDKVLVTEAMPMTSNGKGTKAYTFEKLATNNSSTLQHHAVTLEYTSNPAWYVIQALPYMLEYPHDCSEQIFTRFYANAIASNIVKSSPKIKEIFEKWKTSSPEAFLSNLEKNQQLKAVILEETPWVLNAQSESERKKRVALLFDFNKMDNELAKNLKQLTEAQTSNGGFPWFAGMPENRYITQYIVSGMGHLNQLNIISVKENKEVRKMIEKAVKYLDARLLDDYNDWKKWYEKNKDKNYNYQPTNIQYLYARSFFPEIKMSKAEEEAFNFYKVNTEKAWTNFGLNSQAMLALASQRNGNSELAQKIMNGILERSITTEEMGMYWKENERGYF